MDWLTDPSIWISLLTLTLLEIVLGIDNLVFISILANKLPEEQRRQARQTGLMAALFSRILLLLSLSWLVTLTNVVVKLPQWSWLHEPYGLSWKDFILLAGGFFLLWKSTTEIHDKLEGEDGHATSNLKAVTFRSVIMQIMVIDIVFSLDSVITAVGMVDKVPVMIAAVVLAMIFMLIFNHAISDFINKHPTLKMLALSFLILVGMVLVAEGLHFHVPKGYVYFAMAFSVGVEILNIKMRAKARAKVKLHQPYR